MNRKEQNRCAELMDGFFDNRLSSEEKRELGEIIASDPEKARTFALHAQLDCSLYNAGAFDEALTRGGASVFNEKSYSSRRKAAVSGKRRFPRIIWISFAACLIIMAGAYFYNIYQMQQIPRLIKARIMERQGKVLIERQGRETIIDLIDDREMEIHAGDVIQTGPQAHAVIQYTDEDTRIEISQDTEISVYEKNRCKIMELETGRIDIRAAKQPEDAGLRVLTPHARVDVVGTIFSVDVSKTSDAKTKPDNKAKPAGSEISNLKSEIPRTRVETYEGKVRVTRKSDKTSLMLAAGQQLAIIGSDDKKLVAADISGWVGVRRGPNGESLRKYKWTFDRDSMQGFQIMQVVEKGRWKWKNSRQTGYSRSGLYMRGAGALKMPIKLRRRPVRATCYGYALVKRSETDRIFLVNVEEAYPHQAFRQWHINDADDAEDKEFIMRKWICGKRMLRLKLGKRVFTKSQDVRNISEYNETVDELMIVARNICICEIRIEEVSTGSLPTPFHSDVSWESLKENSIFSVIE